MTSINVPHKQAGISARVRYIASCAGTLGFGKAPAFGYGVRTWFAGNQRRSGTATDAWENRDDDAAEQIEPPSVDACLAKTERERSG